MTNSTMKQYWIGVASREHVKQGVKGGFAQFCHGKESAAKQPSLGDWVIYYSSKEHFDKNYPCRRFTALGGFVDDAPKQVRQTSSFFPWRKKVAFEECEEIDIYPLLDELSFTQNRKNWGLIFRRGLFKISEDDFNLISTLMRKK